MALVAMQLMDIAQRLLDQRRASRAGMQNGNLVLRDPHKARESHKDRYILIRTPALLHRMRFAAVVSGTLKFSVDGEGDLFFREILDVGGEVILSINDI